jgi:fructose-bisphosphate aldolase class I
MSIHNDQLKKVQTVTGFLAALDQSGGSTPKALKLYGVEESEYANEGEMFDLIHAMRSRIMTSPSFGGDRVLGAILFEMTMDREVQGMPSARYLWQEKNVVPFLKVDKGLADEANGVQIMKPMPELDALCERAVKHDVFGTKMRSVIKLANPQGIADIVKQQFEVGSQISGHGLCPILEPEVDINSPEKAAAEAILKKEMLAHLDALPDGQSVMVKLTLPEESGFYKDVIDHPKMLKVVALSGGYSRDEANSRLTANHGMIASFSRALTQGLSAGQSDSEFNGLLDSAIESIFQASRT